MDEDDHDPLEPLSPAPLPQLNVRRLWVCLLGPLVITAAVLGLMAAMGSALRETELTSAAVAIAIASLIFWISFHFCLKERFRGSSLVGLTLAYPFLQAIVVFAVFFVGCLAILTRSGSY